MEGAAEQAAPEHDLSNLFPGGLRVLLVDGDTLVRVMVEKMLRRCGYDGAHESLACPLHSERHNYCADDADCLGTAQ